MNTAPFTLFRVNGADGYDVIFAAGEALFVLASSLIYDKSHCSAGQSGTYVEKVLQRLLIALFNDALFQLHQFFDVICYDIYRLLDMIYRKSRPRLFSQCLSQCQQDPCRSI